MICLGGAVCPRDLVQRELEKAEREFQAEDFRIQKLIR